jgi:signal transduction histidine kinase
MPGFPELLGKGAAASLNEKSQRYLAIILEAANRMGNLIDDLLALSRIIRAGAHNSTFNLDQLVEGAVAEAREEANARTII